MVRQAVALGTVFLLGVALAAAGLIAFNQRQQTPALIIHTPQPQATAVPTATQAPLQVYVNGAVVYPDVYILPHGSRIKQAVQAAGGFTQEADDVPINLAEPLSDGMYIYVPALGETSPPLTVQQPAGAAQRSVPVIELSGITNINTASKAELEALPGIGPAIAQRILDYRQENGAFPRIESILDVPGIGEVKFEQIRALISTGP